MRATVMVAALGLSGFGFAATALAGAPQDTRPPATAEDSEAGPAEVIVSTSRITRDGFEAPTPLTVIGPEELQAAAPSKIADYINYLPQIQGSTVPRGIVAQTGPGLQGANVLNLRALSVANTGANRTLVLLDGRRVAPVTPGGSVDVNVLPTALTQRVDIVTGGASAAWGSDAVAGVVNFVLDKKFTGLKGEVDYGATMRGDAGSTKYSATFGTPFSAGRGHILFNAEYNKYQAGNEIRTRPWYVGAAVVNNPAYVAGNGQAGRIVATNVNLSTASPGGLITSGPLRGTNYGVGGVTEPFSFGVINGALMVGGTDTKTVGAGQVAPAGEQVNAFSRFSFDVTPDFTAYAEASFAHDDVPSPTPVYTRNGDLTIRNDNPFIPAATRALMAAQNVTTFSFGKAFWEFGYTGTYNVRAQRRGVVGADGSFGDTGAWHAYYQYGRSNIINAVANNPIVPRLVDAVDVISNPATGGVAGVAVGAPVCRSTLSAPTNGCVPMNVFGIGSASAASIAAIMGEARRDVVYTQQVAALNGQIEPFSTWAGPVSLAGGFEFRKEEYTQQADPISLTASFSLGNYSEGTGNFDAKEGFLETVVPLLKDKPFAQALDLNAAVRLTDYSTSGRVTSWKLGVVHDLTDALRLRATRSRDIRAANLSELYQGAGAQRPTLTDYGTPGNPSIRLVTFNLGNPDLDPELADTVSAGIVFRPGWLQGFTTSLDYYQIKVDGAITTPIVPGAGRADQSVINQCYGFNTPQVTSACSRITRVNGVITSIVVSPVNANSLKTSGFDLELGYRTPLAGGDLSVRFLATKVREFVTQQPAAPLLDTLDTTGPRSLTYLFSGSYQWGPSRTTATVRYLGAGRFSNDPAGTATYVEGNHIDSVQYISLAESYKLEFGDTDLELFAVIDNLFDVDPPIAPNNAAPTAPGGIGTGTEFDLLGRRYRAGIRLRF
jgi:iron complex outermembrane receptor protein